jgi:hypothetical protein
VLATTFAVTLAVLYAAHSVADHWIQTDHQAVAKGARTRAGQLADLRHVTTYTLTLAAALAVAAWRVGLHYDPAHVPAGLALNAITHYWADRRVYLLALARRIGKSGWLDTDPQAAYQLDQSWHIGCLLVTALIIV